jgi:5-methylcytosine-specific restriction enzyme A
MRMLGAAISPGKTLTDERGRTRRAIPLGTVRWRTIRLLVIRDNPICGCGSLTTDVDHIDNDPDNNDWDNLQALCKKCHSRKTAREVGLNGP